MLFIRIILAFMFILLAAYVQAGARHQAEIVIPKSEQWLYDNWHFAPALVLDDTVYVSGVIGEKFEGEGATQKQIMSAFKKIELILKKSGSSMDDVLDITSFHVGMNSHLKLFRDIKDQYIKPPYPAWTAIGVTELAVPWGVVEIKVIAKKSK